MKQLKAASAFICLTATAMILSPGMQGQQTGDYNKKTNVTFSAPVEIPGVHMKGYGTLPAGTYVFKLVNSQVNRHIVQIQNADESKTYATILAVPNMRLKPTSDTVITFSERPAGEPPAIRAWFYPGASWGEEFVYKKSRAKELAAANKTPVLYSSDDTSAEVTEPIQATPADLNAAQIGAYNQTGDEVELAEAVTAPSDQNTASSSQSTSVANNAEPPARNDDHAAASANVQMAQNTPPPAPTPMPATVDNTASTRSEMPQTASPLGLYMLGGLLALGGAFGVRSMRQRYQ